MNGKLVAVADALVVDLNAETWSQAFAARRLFRPQFDLAELADLQATVAPSSMRRLGGDRRGPFREIDIDLAFQQRLAQGGQDQRIAELIALVEEVDEHFVRAELDSMPGAFCAESSFEPVYAPDHLEQFDVFTGVLRCTFRLLTPGS